MKALVTGATGFVGSHLARHLVGAGVEVVCLTRSTSNLDALESLTVQTHQGSLENEASLQSAVQDVDYVFHVAGLTRGRKYAEYHAANVEGTRRIVQAALARADKLQRFVHVSSLAALGPYVDGDPPDETAEPHPTDHYGRSKLAGEQVALAAADRMPVTVIRPPGVYGPRDTNFLPVFRTARRHGFIPVMGKADKQVALIHAADLAEGMWLAAQSPAAVGQVYFLGGGIYSLEEMAQAFETALDLRLRRLRIPTLAARLAGEWGQLKWALTGRPQILSRRKVRDMLHPRWTCSWAKAQRDLGFQPTIELHDGFRQTAQWYIEHGWI